MRMSEKIDITTKYMQSVAFVQGRDWISPTEIGRELFGGHSAVGTPVCKKMVELGMAERNIKGHYKLITDEL